MDVIQSQRRIFLTTASLILFLAFLIWVINLFYFQFHGNNYFPSSIRLSGVYLLCGYTAVRMFCDADDYIVEVLHNILYLYVTFAVITLLSCAIQLTPFHPIDSHVIALETYFGLDMTQWMAWAARYPDFRYLLQVSYKSIAWQMSVLPFVLGFFNYKRELREFYCLLLISALLGFVFYYFFPTTAPASNLNSPYFIPEQYDTGLKFRQIQANLIPQTLEGGLIALPSFHVVWACLCLYLARVWRPLLILSLPLNMLLISSCVLLGWHYFLDVAGAFMTLFLSYMIYHGALRRLSSPAHHLAKPLHS